MALSGSQQTRLAVGGAGRPYAGFVAKVETLALNDVLLDGANTSIINTDYGDKTLYFNGTHYYSVT